MLCLRLTTSIPPAKARLLASLYVNGKLQGAVRQPLVYKWDLSKVAIMLGIEYIGDLDDLMIFRRAITAGRSHFSLQVSGKSVTDESPIAPTDIVPWASYQFMFNPEHAGDGVTGNRRLRLRVKRLDPATRLRNMVALRCVVCIHNPEIFPTFPHHKLSHMQLATVLTPMSDENLQLAAQCGVTDVVHRYPGSDPAILKAAQSESNPGECSCPSWKDICR